MEGGRKEADAVVYACSYLLAVYCSPYCSPADVSPPTPAKFSTPCRGDESAWGNPRRRLGGPLSRRFTREETERHRLACIRSNERTIIEHVLTSQRNRTVESM